MTEERVRQAIEARLPMLTYRELRLVLVFIRELMK